MPGEYQPGIRQGSGILQRGQLRESVGVQEGGFELGTGATSLPAAVTSLAILGFDDFPG
jgi:hypothetical protein